MNVLLPFRYTLSATLIVAALIAPAVVWAHDGDEKTESAENSSAGSTVGEAKSTGAGLAETADASSGKAAEAEATEATDDSDELDFQMGDWQVAIGIASFSVPTYLGDNDYESLVVPNLEVRYKDRLNLSLLTGLNYDVLNRGEWSAGPFLDYDFGRDVSSELIGFREVNPSIEVGGFVEYQRDNVTARVKVLRGIGGHEGTSITATLRHAKLYDTGLIPLYFLIGPAMRFGDSDYLNTYLGVTEQQSLDSGLAQTSMSGGIISFGLDAVLVVPLSRNIFIRNFFLLENLTSDAARSPIVTNQGERLQRTLGIELGYVF